MNDKLIDKLFMIIASCQTVIMAFAFIIQILRIYNGNNKTFSRDICAEYINQILPIIIVWIIIIIGSFVYFNIKGSAKEKTSKISNVVKMNNLQKIAPDNNSEILIKEEKHRKTAKIISIIIVVICSIMGICYLVNVEHFKSDGTLTSEDLFDQAIQMALHLAPWVIISFGTMIVTAFYEEYSARCSIEELKHIIKTNGKATRTSLNKKDDKVILIAQIAILIIAAVFIIHGIYNGGAQDVLIKAINICTECIGLG